MTSLMPIRIAMRAMSEMGYSSMAQAYAHKKLGFAANEILASPHSGLWEMIQFAWEILTGRTP